MRTCSFFLSLCLLLLFSTAGALFGYVSMGCQSSSSPGCTYLEQAYLNKVLLGEYNCAAGKYVGYTEKAKEVTEAFNKSPAFLKQAKKNEGICKDFMSKAAELFATVEPYVRLRSAKIAGSKHPGVLVCSVYDFYPKQIKVTWLRNGQETTTDVTSSEELPNGNWLYQIHSYLEFTPRPGEKITCMMEHASLMQPMLTDWELTPESTATKIAVGSSVLLLGVVFLVAGLICYKRNTNGRELVPADAH